MGHRVSGFRDRTRAPERGRMTPILENHTDTSSCFGEGVKSAAHRDKRRKLFFSEQNENLCRQVTVENLKFQG